MSSSTRTLLYVLSFITLILLGILVAGVYMIRAKNNETSEILNKADEVAETQILAQSIRVDKETAAADIEEFNNFILTEDKIVDLIESIEITGATMGLDVEIISVDSGKEKKDEDLGEVEMIIESDGSWTQNFAFLKALENIPYKSSVKESSISKGEVDWTSRNKLTLLIFK